MIGAIKVDTTPTICISCLFVPREWLGGQELAKSGKRRKTRASPQGSSSRNHEKGLSMDAPQSGPKSRFPVRTFSSFRFAMLLTLFALPSLAGGWYFIQRLQGSQ